MHLEEMTLRETQCAALEILKKVDDVCKSLGIKYYIIYGTLLGVVRHKGFIPWDDDIDIGMKIEDYNKFVEFFMTHKEELSPLEIHNHKTNKYCFYNISRVCDNTYVIKFNALKYQSGAFIDIYPFEGLGNEEDRSYWVSKFKNMQLLKKGLSMCSSKSILFGTNIFTRLANIPFMIFARCVGKKYFISKLTDYKKFSWDDSEYVGCPCWEKTYHKKVDYDETIQMQFENFVVSVPSSYDRILKTSYGNYMELPPENQRHPGHNYTAYKKVE